MLSTDHLVYKILHKVINHHEIRPTVKLIFIETVDEIKLSEFVYRMFLRSLEAQGYLKIANENKDDWGPIIVSAYGEQFVKEFPSSENFERDYDNLSEYLGRLIIKSTKDLIRAKKSAEIHLQKQEEAMEYQRGLATNGKPNCYSTYVRQVDTVKLEIHKIEEELETRHNLVMETANQIGSAAIVLEKPLTREQKMQKDHDSWIDKNFTFRNTVKDFDRLRLASRAALSEKDYILELLKWSEFYGNYSHFYCVWGPSDLYSNHAEIYKQISEELDEINAANLLKTISVKTVATVNNGTATQIETAVDAITLNTIINNFDSVLVIDVYNHFYNALVKPKHLSENGLLAYLKCAFDEQKT